MGKLLAGVGEEEERNGRNVREMEKGCVCAMIPIALSHSFGFL